MEERYEKGVEEFGHGADARRCAFRRSRRTDSRFTGGALRLDPAVPAAGPFGRRHREGGMTVDLFLYGFASWIVEGKEADGIRPNSGETNARRKGFPASSQDGSPSGIGMGRREAGRFMASGSWTDELGESAPVA
jgi:hypothetical protein